MSNRTICDQDTPDPWILPSPHHPPNSPLFYLTFTLGNRIELWASASLEDFRSAQRTTIWQPQQGSPFSEDIWAPEIHFMFGTFWIYAAGAQPGQGNPSHRTIVLRCTDPQNPMAGPQAWHFEGPLRGVPDDQWAIDATVFSPDPGLDSDQNVDPNQGAAQGKPDDQRRWYVVYSGWPLGDHSDTQQDLFIARLRTPTEAIRESLTCISHASLPWERPDGGKRGVNEGPTWVSFSGAENGQGWRGIVYSGHGSWTSEYKLGVVQYTGRQEDDPCHEQLWRKKNEPLLISGDSRAGGPYGPGHASFIRNPGGSGKEVFCIYHGTEHEGEGWNNRKGRVLCLSEDCFLEGRGALCCANSICGMTARQGHQGEPGGAPITQTGHAVQTPSAQSHVSGGRFGDIGKYADKVGKYVPPQYQGVFNKAKDFLNKH